MSGILQSFVSGYGTGAGGNTDPYWSSVVLLIGNDNAADGTTTFTDQSVSAHSVTRSGTVTSYSNTTAPTGMTTAINNTATTGYLTTAYSADWYFAAGDFTIEAMVYLDASTYFPVANRWAGSAGNNIFDFLMPKVGTDNNAYLSYSSDGTNAKGITAATSLSTATWYHVTMVRHGVDFMFFINGTQVGSTYNASTDSLYNISTSLLIFRDTSSRTGVGRISNLRITKGVARYTGTFTPPTLPMPTS